MVPVRDAGNDDTLEVVEQGVEVLALLGHRGRHRGRDLARADLRQHGEVARALEVTHDPRGRAFQRLGEFAFVHNGWGRRGPLSGARPPESIA
jgi:hypothetical protein